VQNKVSPLLKKLMTPFPSTLYIADLYPTLLDKGAGNTTSNALTCAFAMARDFGRGEIPMGRVDECNVCN
jgi:hypothetical protein